MQYLANFILSEGNKYQNLQLASDDINPQKAPGSPPRGLDGWSYMMRTPEKDFALLYFENKAVKPILNGFQIKFVISFPVVRYYEWKMERNYFNKIRRKRNSFCPGFTR